MVTSADYADWLDQSGLYVRNYSHAERYQTFEKRISPEGLNVRIVFDFLQQNRDGIDVQAWRNYYVYENDGGLRYRIERTAEALAAVGAPGASEAVRTSQNTTLLGQLTSGFLAGADPLATLGSVDLSALMQEFQRSAAAALGGDDFVLDEETQELVPRCKRRSSVESRDEIAALLRTYVERHAASLQADVDRHGDVRQQPGFDPARRQAELAEILRRQNDRERQIEAVAKARPHMEKVEQAVAKHGQQALRKLRSTRRKLLQTRREFAGRAPDELLPEMRNWLEEFGRFAERHASIFRPAPVDDAALLERLSSFGEYEYDAQEFGALLNWDSPRGFDADWNRFTLSVVYPDGNAEVLSAALDACDRVRRDFDRIQATLREQVLENFGVTFGGSEEFDDAFAEMLDHARDPAGSTDDKILARVGHGRLSFQATYDPPELYVGATVHFSVDWDEEHGLDLDLDLDEQEPEEASPAGTASVTFSPIGRAPSDADIARFEAEIGFDLPVEYRTYLLGGIGGTPQPNHLIVRDRGHSWPVDVSRLYSLNVVGPEEPDLTVAYRERGTPPHYLTIGVANALEASGAGALESKIMLSLHGPSRGEVSLFTLPPGFAEAMRHMPPEMVANMGVGTKIASNFCAFLAKLVERPQHAKPAWLEAIESSDAAALIRWIEEGGDLSQRVRLCGESMPPTMLERIVRHGSTELMAALVGAGKTTPKALRTAWFEGIPSARDFCRLLPVLPGDQRVYAFASPDVWDHPDLLRELESQPLSFDQKIGPEGETPLHYAVLAGRADGASWLLTRGATPGVTDKYARTPLVWAESERRLDCMLLLLDAGESLESLFRHMPTLPQKMALIRSRWPQATYEELQGALSARGIFVETRLDL